MELRTHEIALRGPGHDMLFLETGLRPLEHDMLSLETGLRAFETGLRAPGPAVTPGQPKTPARWRRGAASARGAYRSSLTPPLAMNPSVGAQISANDGAVRGPRTTGP